MTTLRCEGSSQGGGPRNRSPTYAVASLSITYDSSHTASEAKLPRLKEIHDE